MAKNTELKYEIINCIGIVSKTPSGWQTELNRISWNGNEPKYDLRTWSPDHKIMGKGITLSEEELVALAAILRDEMTFLSSDTP